MPKKRKPSAAKQAGNEPLGYHLFKVVAATVMLLVFVFLAGLAFLLLTPIDEPAVKTTAVPGKPATGIIYEIYPKEKKQRPARSLTADDDSRPSSRPDGQRPRIAIIIDDVGYDREMAQCLIGIDRALTLSVLPHSPFSKEIAAAATGAGMEIMLHLPMEPVEYPHVDPGPGVLLADMSPDILLRQLEENIADVPSIIGVNNHMGSRLTAESIQLYQIFSVLKKRGLFFVDSRTTEKSLCRPSAGKLRVPFAERDVFLDNSLSAADIARQLDLLVVIAGRRGTAIGIGHPHPETCRVLQKHLPALKKQADLVPVSALVGPGDQ